MDTKDILTIVFSSTLITTMITVVFNLLASKKKDAIENITKERKQWRDQLRAIARAIQESRDMEQLHLALTDLKVRINAYGMAKSSFFCDTHFWMQIHRLESDASLSQEALQTSKTAFVNQISCLLKYDWERSKAEIKGNTQTKIVIISLAISFFLYSVRWFYYYSTGTGTGEIGDYLTYCLYYVIYAAFAMLVIYAADKWTQYFWLNLYHCLLLILDLVAAGICIVSLYLSIRSGAPNDPNLHSLTICVSPCAVLLYCARSKLLAYRNNVRDFILASAISAGYDVIDKKYKVFFWDAPPINIFTNQAMAFVDTVDLSGPPGSDAAKPD